MRKVKELRRTNWYLQNRDGDVKHTIGNIANVIVQIVCGGRWAVEFINYISVQLLCCIPETSVIWSSKYNGKHYCCLKRHIFLLNRTKQPRKRQIKVVVNKMDQTRALFLLRSLL